MCVCVRERERERKRKREREREITNAHKGNGKLEEREEINAHRSAQITNTCTPRSRRECNESTLEEYTHERVCSMTF